jgi:hypothetical protein
MDPTTIQAMNLHCLKEFVTFAFLRVFVDSKSVKPTLA